MRSARVFLLSLASIPFSKVPPVIVAVLSFSSTNFPRMVPPFMMTSLSRAFRAISACNTAPSSVVISPHWVTTAQYFVSSPSLLVLLMVAPFFIVQVPLLKRVADSAAPLMVTPVSTIHSAPDSIVIPKGTFLLNCMLPPDFDDRMVSFPSFITNAPFDVKLCPFKSKIMSLPKTLSKYTVSSEEQLSSFASSWISVCCALA